MDWKGFYCAPCTEESPTLVLVALPCFPYCFRYHNLESSWSTQPWPYEKNGHVLWFLLAKNWSLYRSSLIFRFVSKSPFHILRFPFHFLLGVNTSTFQWLQPSSLAMLWLHWKSRLQSIRRPRNQKDKSWIASQWHGTLVTSRASMFPWKEMVVRRDDFGYGLGIHLFFASPAVIHKTC